MSGRMKDRMLVYCSKDAGRVVCEGRKGDGVERRVKDTM